MNILTEDIAIWRLNLIFQSRGWYVGIYKRGSLKSTKLGRYYIINHFTNEMIDFLTSLHSGWHGSLLFHHGNRSPEKSNLLAKGS